MAKTPDRLRQGARRFAARKGYALPDGSFPIRNMSELSDAIQAWGRAKDKAKAKRHILKRARALGASDRIIERIKALGTS